MNTKNVHSGFTLVELVVTLAIFALIMLFAAPSFFQQIQRERIRAAAENMYNYTLTAQELATSSGRVVGIAPLTNATWIDQPIIMAYISEADFNNPTNAGGTPAPIRSAAATVIASETIFNATDGQYTLTVARNAINTQGAADLFTHRTLDYIYFFPDGIVSSPNFLLTDSNNNLVSMVSNCFSNVPSSKDYFEFKRNFYKIGFTHFAPNTALPDVNGQGDSNTNANCWTTSN